MANLSKAKFIYWFFAILVFLSAFACVTDAIRACAAYGIPYGKALAIVVLAGFGGIILSTWTFVSKRVCNRLDRLYPRDQQIPKPLQLVTTGRAGDVHVQVEGRAGVWGSGKNTYEAVGDMITHHPEVFDIILTQQVKSTEGGEK